MKQIMRKTKTFFILALVATIFTACNSEDSLELTKKSSLPKQELRQNSYSINDFLLSVDSLNNTYFVKMGSANPSLHKISQHTVYSATKGTLIAMADACGHYVGGALGGAAGASVSGIGGVVGKWVGSRAGSALASYVYKKYLDREKSQCKGRKTCSSRMYGIHRLYT